MTWLLMSLACSRAPIEDRWSHGSITQIKDVFTSAFVLETSEGWIVIDTGFNAESKPVANLLEEQSAELSDIQTMLFTHGHTDHIGGWQIFRMRPFTCMKKISRCSLKLVHQTLKPLQRARIHFWRQYH